jgi:DNA repair protein RadA/Sms
MAFRCDTCSYSSGKWMGFCPQCGSQVALTEVVEAGLRTGTKSREPVPVPVPVPLSKVGENPVSKAPVGISEFDRVLGGGLVPGSAILLGGEPGVGKSTLALQIAMAMVAAGGKVLVATAEESSEQVGLRAQRLAGMVAADGDLDAILLLPGDDIDGILAVADEQRPDLVLIDSIQTVGAREVGGAPGGVAQVRECAARAIRFAKDRGVSVVLIGHVTKDGGIAGPKLLEHMVDVVLYLEGDPDHGLRTLRSLKNRFGATHQAGLFEMRQEGMVEVADPSAALIDGFQGTVPGTAVLPTVDGRRPMLVEVQALVLATSHPQPRRSFRGVDQARVPQLLAVLERHAGLSTAGSEVYVNVVGGVRVTEPAADLAVALAIASSLQDRALGSVAAWGEVGLAGELRSVPMDATRREEAARLGIKTHISPQDGGPKRLIDALTQAALL